MSNTSSTPFLLPSDDKYDGSNWLQFKTTIIAVAKQRGTLAYLKGELPRPRAPVSPAVQVSTSYWGSSTPTCEEWDQRDAWTQGLVSLNVKNPVGLGIKTDGTAAETWASIVKLMDAKSILGCMAAEQELSNIKFVEGMDMWEHITKLRTAWAKANDQGADIKDEKFRMIIMKSMPTSWMTFVGSLYSEDSSDKIITRLVAHSIFIAGQSPQPRSNQALSLQGGRQVRNPHLKCSNPACGRSGHTIERCFKPGGGMEGQFPEWWKKKDAVPTTQSKTNIAASAVGDPFAHLALSAVQSGHPDLLTDDVVTYIDSAATGYFFVRREDFVDYQETQDSGATADGGKFHIAGVGKVRKRVEYNGRTITLTFEDAQHTPNLSHNLLSIGRLEHKGVYVVFKGGKATFFSKEDVPFMESRHIGDGFMYQVDWSPMPAAYSARSLTKPADLATWHRRLGHISEASIASVIAKRLVDGIAVIGSKPTGKCEDCIFGKQPRRPFDSLVC